MDKKTIKEFYDVIKMFDTTLYALKWQKENEKQNLWGYDAIITNYEQLLKKLKLLCINHIGILDE